MELEVGQFVRYKNGIGKIVGKYVKGVLIDKGIAGYFRTENEDILKASNNIIDLIEVGDVIKFVITDTDNYVDIQGYNCWEISCEEELNGVKEMIEMESAKLISIVTKEMFANAEYRVETN